MAAMSAGTARMPSPTVSVRAKPSLAVLATPASAGSTRWRPIRIVSKTSVRGWSRRGRVGSNVAAGFIASDAIVAAAQRGQAVAEGLRIRDREARDVDGTADRAGGVDDDAGEPESPLEGALARVDVL